jgi:hypothetical protein
MALAASRLALEGDTDLTGGFLCRAYSDLVDEWLAELLVAAEAEVGAHDVALVAVGGYGRAELSLQSDIDVVLLHAGAPPGTRADCDCAVRANGAIIESRNGSDRAMPVPRRNRRREIAWRVEANGA